MTLRELKEKVEWLAKTGSGDDEVVVVLKEPSVGRAAGAGVARVGRGFDWDSDRIMIEAAEPLTRYAKDRDVPMPMIRREYDMGYGKKVIVRRCRRCEEKLRVRDAFCPRCGQAAKEA